MKYYSCSISTSLKGNNVEIDNIWKSELSNEPDYFEYCSFTELLDSIEEESTIYVHELRQFGDCLIYYLENNGYSISTGSQAIRKKSEDKTYKSLIDRINNDYFNISFNYNSIPILVINSMKLINSSLTDISDSFNLDLTYCKEDEDTENECLFVSAMMYEFVTFCNSNGIEVMNTISGTAYNYFKSIYSDFENDFSPNSVNKYCYYYGKTLRSDIGLNKFNYFNVRSNSLGSNTIKNDKYFRPLNYFYCAYYPGFLKIFEGKKNVECHNGISLDVNSLYAYSLHSVSGNYYPVGWATFNSGIKFFEDEKISNSNDSLFIVRIRILSLKVKEGKIDFISSLKEDNVLSDGSYNVYTLPSPYYWLFIENYESKYEVIDYCYFRKSKKGIFDSYVDKFYEIKKNSTGAKRKLAKQFLNSLGGKFGYIPKDEYIYEFNQNGIKNVKKSKTAKINPYNIGYLPVAVFMNAYAACFTIKCCEQHIDKICYVDTDSMHLVDITEDEIRLPISDTELGYWKIEHKWDCAIFHELKSYILIKDDDITIKCAGMTESTKEEYKNMNIVVLKSRFMGNKINYTMKRRYQNSIGGCVRINEY